MELKSISIRNFRSLKSINCIEVNKYTVIIGKNNEGKTNVLNAIAIAMATIRINNTFIRRPGQYRFNRDYPVDLQKEIDYTKLNSKNSTLIELSFELSDIEATNFKKQTNIKINNSLCISVSFEYDGSSKKVVPVFRVRKKTGKGALSFNKKIRDVLQFISTNFYFSFIPAVRTENQSINAVKSIVNNNLEMLKDDLEYSNALDVVIKKQNKLFDQLSADIKTFLTDFIPSLNEASIKRENFYFDNDLEDFDFLLDDGVETSLFYKGDGIKSLAAIAMIKSTLGKNGLIAVEEPESHLHSGAIHKLQALFLEMSEKQQVIITTHNPVFVDSLNLKNNYLITAGTCKTIDSLHLLKDELGICVSEGMCFSENVILVEGENDKKFFKHCFSLLDEELKAALNQRKLQIISSNSASKIPNDYAFFKQNAINVFCIFDNDEEGKKAASKISNKNVVTSIPTFKKKETVIEDVFVDKDILEKVFTELNIAVNIKGLLNSKQKFSNALDWQLQKAGITLDDDRSKIIGQVKELLLKHFMEMNSLDSIDQNNIEYLQNLIVNIKKNINI